MSGICCCPLAAKKLLARKSMQNAEPINIAITLSAVWFARMCCMKREGGLVLKEGIARVSTFWGAASPLIVGLDVGVQGNVAACYVLHILNRTQWVRHGI